MVRGMSFSVGFVQIDPPPQNEAKRNLPSATLPRLKIPLPLAGERVAPDYGSNLTPRGVLFATGFRPFFGGAALVGALLVPLWIGMLRSAAPSPPHFNPIAWHAHEMLFGYTAAVLAGFLLTAVAKWTKRPTATGAPLMGLFLLWLGGRVVMLPALGVPAMAAAVVDLAFLPALAFTLGRPIVGSRNTRNYGFVVLLLVMAGANTVLHVRALQGQPLPRAGLQTAVDVVALFMLVVGARIIPQFTGNALKVETTRSPRWGRVQLALAVAVLGMDVVGAPEEAIAAAALCAGAATLIRMRGWKTAATRTVPMLWVLHAGYAWVAVAFLLRGAQPYVVAITPSLPVHAMTAGAIGTLTLGMMARVSMGHTGRLIKARPAVTAAFVAMVAAGLVGYLGVTAGLATGLAYLLGVLLMVAALYVFGRQTDAPDADS